MRIGVIGGGLSGSLAAIYLLKHTNTPLTIYLFEKNPAQLNKGVAYSSRLPYQLLNVPIKDMSLFTDEPGHFYEWLQKNGYNYNFPHFAPRDVYGRYITDTFAAETKMGKQGAVTIVPDEVTGIEKAANEYMLTYGEGETIITDKVILCTGNFPPGDVPGLTQEIRESKQYISHPWGGFDVGSVQPDADILMVGSGLTMTDLVLSLERNRHKGKITVLSRRGLLPLPHGVAPAYIPADFPALNKVTVLSLVQWVRQNINTASAQNKNWRSVIDSLRPHIPAIWAALHIDEKKRFLRHLRPVWEIHRHRMPAESIAIMNRMRQEGRLSLLAGRIQNAEISGNEITVSYKCRNNGQGKSIAVNTIINCTGPETEYRKIRSPLYKCLIESKLVQHEPLSLGLLITTDGFIIEPGGEINRSVAVIGPPAKGVLWEATALREIRLQAEAVAKAMSKEVF